MLYITNWNASVSYVTERTVVSEDVQSHPSFDYFQTFFHPQFIFFSFESQNSVRVAFAMSKFIVIKYDVAIECSIAVGSVNPPSGAAVPVNPPSAGAGRPHDHCGHPSSHSHFAGEYLRS